MRFYYIPVVLCLTGNARQDERETFAEKMFQRLFTMETATVWVMFNRSKRQILLSDTRRERTFFCVSFSTEILI